MSRSSLSAAQAARPNPYSSACDALAPLEDPIIRARKLSELLKFVAEMHGEGGTAEFIKDCARNMAFLAEEIHAQVDAIDDLWRERWSVVCTAEREVAR